jgi:hypothetical protein
MGLNHSPRIVTDGLVLCLDAANRRSYPGSGNTWIDLSGNGYHLTLTNGPTYSSNNSGGIVFDGINDYALGTDTIRVGGKNKTLTTEIAFFLPTSGIGMILTNQRQGGDNGQGLYTCSNTTLQFEQHSRTAPPYLYYLTASAQGFSNLRIDGWNIVSWGLTIGTSNISCNYMINGYTETISNTIVWDGVESLTDDNLEIGRWKNHTYGDFYGKQTVGSLKVYNRVLSVSEQLRNFNALRGRYGI